MEGTAECFGTELVLDLDYIFTGTKSAIFTYHGCTLEVTYDLNNFVSNWLQQSKTFSGIRTTSQLYCRGNTNDIVFEFAQEFRRKEGKKFSHICR